MRQRPGRSTILASTAALAALVLTAAGAHAAQGKAGETKAVAGRDVASRSSAADEAVQGKRSEYGIALAMAGEYRNAESVFVSVLSASPGDARALTNLGNLRVLNGDLEVALAFYDQALRAGQNEAGIVLNRATTLMLMGEIERAEAEAARGIALAGGEAEAAKLLGLSSAKPGAAQRGSDKPYVSKQEIRALLHAATSRVPGDSMKSSAADSTKAAAKVKRPAKTWRSAGPRAGDGGEIASVLYWKR